MTNYTNDDLYQMLLHRLRKDRKGSVSPEEFETFLRWRNLDYFNKQLGVEGGTKINHESLAPFSYYQDLIPFSTSVLGEYYVLLDADYVGPTVEYKVAHVMNAWLTYSDTDISSKVHIDLVSSAEFSDRLNNAITRPSAAEPVGFIGKGDHATAGNTDVLWVFANSDLSGYGVALDYYKYPADPYFDYYTDADGNITYLTDGRAAYTLKTNEVSRGGSTAGTAVTSASEDLEWDDHHALNILDMIVSDVSIALSDPNSFQASLLERKENVSS